jgi:hypothetical protein
LRDHRVYARGIAPPTASIVDLAHSADAAPDADRVAAAIRVHEAVPSQNNAKNRRQQEFHRVGHHRQHQ